MEWSSLVLRSCPRSWGTSRAWTPWHRCPIIWDRCARPTAAALSLYLERFCTRRFQFPATQTQIIWLRLWIPKTLNWFKIFYLHLQLYSKKTIASNINAFTLVWFSHWKPLLKIKIKLLNCQIKHDEMVHLENALYTLNFKAMPAPQQHTFGACKTCGELISFITSTWMAPCGIPVGTVDRKRWTSEMTASVKGQEDKSLTPRLLSSACHIHKRARKDYIECTTCRGDAKKSDRRRRHWTLVWLGFSDQDVTQLLDHRYSAD